MKEQTPKLQDLATKMIQATASGKVSPQEVKAMVNTIGIILQAAVREKITTIQEPALAPRTILAKGSSKPWIDTGQLRSSVTYSVDRGGDNDV